MSSIDIHQRMGVVYGTKYLLTAIGLPSGCSSTVHIYTKTIHRTTQIKKYTEQNKNFGRMRTVSRLGELYPGICLITEEEGRKNLSQGRKNLSQGRKNHSQGCCCYCCPAIYTVEVSAVKYCRFCDLPPLCLSWFTAFSASMNFEG